jgi:hypothetical protein
MWHRFVAANSRERSSVIPPIGCPNSGICREIFHGAKIAPVFGASAPAHVSAREISGRVEQLQKKDRWW